MKEILEKFGLTGELYGGFDGEWFGNGDILESYSPIDGSLIGRIRQADGDDYERIVKSAEKAFEVWRSVPAPKRGLLIRALGDKLREHKDDLGALVSLEMGKIIAEGKGEVQEMIDICDFAVGLSRQLYGLTMKSEREEHLMMEQWHPLGIVGTISAFNFPVAVWSWNIALSVVCGNSNIWKPSSKTPLTAIACTKLAEEVCREMDVDPAILSLLVGRGRDVGEKMLLDRRIRLISATGSCSMGYRVGRIVGERLGKTILELGGNNAIIVTPDADMEMALRAILFGAIGTTGQRCTSTRRIIVHKSIKQTLVDRLISAYKQVRIGDPLDPNTIMGPMVDTGAVDDMMNAIKLINEQGGKILYGGDHLDNPGGCYVTPCIAEAKNEMQIVQEETFAPILYIIEYEDFDEALRLHNDVRQGLSSSIFTNNFLEAHKFLSEAGSDCGIANVNIGTSGAEIGGAFGGEKETGGGRESGSDSWKIYMRRQTNTLNFAKELILAQGIKFGE
ncbi:MAG TPA: aldehyde dehydrogenase family protein [candidate division Zixibacteria bacterium]|mgnify:CR=1 FL=1|nr:aldehyde dehydrogenase family protein [candidate division Zixibacteria bacterium]